MEFYWRALPTAIILAGHLPRLHCSRTGTFIRVSGYLLLAFNITLSDPLADMLLLLTIGVGAVTTMYATRYSRLKYGSCNLALAVDLFNISMSLVFTSKYLIELVTFWLLTELIGFFLIAYDYITARSEIALSAATKYLLFSMIPTDISLFILLALTGFNEAFDVELRAISPNLSHPLISIMVVLGFFSKAAVFPLHFWLPDAHSVAPSPASSLLSGLMVKMGIYAIYLLTHYPVDTGVVFTLMFAAGCFTIVYGALQAIVQHDIKRILAYSTTSNTALIILLTALYTYSKDIVFLEAALLYTLVHGVYKATLFLDSGVIELLTHERDVRRLGFISKISPFETATAMLTVLVIFGLPPSIGFLAKVFLFSSISKHLEESWIYLLALIVASLKVFLSVIYNVSYLRAHIGRKLESGDEFDARALSLQPFVFTLALVAFALTFPPLVLSYPDYTEFALLKKIMPAIAASIVLLAFIMLFMLGFLKKGSPNEQA